MALFSLPGIKICGISAAVPENMESNAGYRWISMKERESLMKNIGVITRRVARKGTTTSDLCVVAAEKLLEDLKWKRTEVELLIFVSQSRDYLVPTTACIIQDRLNLPTSCMTLDIGLGCTGYVYGLSVIGSMMQTGAIKKALLMVGDISTLTTCYRDKSTYPLFGDAGTVTALEYYPAAPMMHFNLQTDGSGYQALMIKDGGARNGISRRSFKTKKVGQGIYRSRLHLEMDGIEVFNFALREVVPNIKKLLAYASGSLAEIDYVVFHQANRIINETLRKMLKLESEKVPYSIRDFGNTSGGSVPLTMITALRQPLGTGRKKLLLSAFGVGLSWGSVIVETECICIPDLLEL
jgi:3-oxoacyl-[acyl-carrier-protein] synthase III